MLRSRRFAAGKSHATQLPLESDFFLASSIFLICCISIYSLCSPKLEYTWSTGGDWRSITAMYYMQIMKVLNIFKLWVITPGLEKHIPSVIIAEKAVATTRATLSPSRYDRQHPATTVMIFTTTIILVPFTALATSYNSVLSYTLPFYCFIGICTHNGQPDRYHSQCGGPTPCGQSTFFRVEQITDKSCYYWWICTTSAWKLSPHRWHWHDGWCTPKQDTWFFAPATQLYQSAFRGAGAQILSCAQAYRRVGWERACVD